MPPLQNGNYLEAEDVGIESQQLGKDEGAAVLRYKAPAQQPQQQHS